MPSSQDRVNAYRDALLESEYIAPEFGSFILQGTPIGRVRQLAEMVARAAVKGNLSLPGARNAQDLIGTLLGVMAFHGELMAPPGRNPKEMIEIARRMTDLHRAGWRLEHFEAVRKHVPEPALRQKVLKTLLQKKTPPERVLDLDRGVELPDLLRGSKPSRGAEASFVEVHTPDAFAKDFLQLNASHLGLLMLVHGIPLDRITSAVHEMMQQHFEEGRKKGLEAGVIDNQVLARNLFERFGATPSIESVGLLFDILKHAGSVSLADFERVRKSAEEGPTRVEILRAFTTARIPFTFLDRLREKNIAPLDFMRRLEQKRETTPTLAHGQLLRNWGKPDTDTEKTYAASINRSLEELGIAKHLSKITSGDWNVRPDQAKAYSKLSGMYGATPYFHSIRVLEDAQSAPHPIPDRDLIITAKAAQKYRLTDPRHVYFVHRVSEKSDVPVEAVLEDLKRLRIKDLYSGKGPRPAEPVHVETWMPHAKSLEKSSLFPSGITRRVSRALVERA